MGAIENRIVIEETHDVSDIVDRGSFTGNMVECQKCGALPLKELKANFKYTQEGNGQHYGLEIENNFLSEFRPSAYTWNVWAGSSVSIMDNMDGTFTVTGTPTLSGGNYSVHLSTFIIPPIPVTVSIGQYFHLAAFDVSPTISRFWFDATDRNTQAGVTAYIDPPNTYAALYTGYNLNEFNYVTLNIYCQDATPVSIKFAAMLFDDNTPRTISSTPAAYTCPITGVDSAEVYISPTQNADRGVTKTLTFPATLYSGAADVLTGSIASNLYPLSVNASFNGALSGLVWIAATNATPVDDDDEIAEGLNSDLFVPTSANYQAANTTGYSVAVDSSGNVLLCFGGETNLANVRSFLASCPFTVYYPLEQTVLIAPQSAYTTKGTNFIWSNTESVTVTYQEETIHKEYTPFMEFTNTDIISVNSESSVSLVGEELYVDQFNTEVNYYVHIPYIFKPTDFDGFMTADSKILCTKSTYDIRLLPYGTRIVHYMGGNISGIWYCKNVERTGREFYKINAMSAIGLMDKQYHKGGIYTGQKFSEVIDEIIGNDYPYVLDGSVANQNVYGWLPYDSKRNNLYQLLLAYGVEIVTGDTGTMYFTFPSAEAATPIPADRVYSGGKVVYDEPASMVEVFEHSYHFDESAEVVTLFDNTSDSTVENALVKFSEPIFPDSISSATLEIIEKSTNYAIVSGSGVLTGKPYIHNIRIVQQTNEDAPKEKVVSVQDATLVTFATADNVLARLSEYYFNATRVEQSILAETEKPGKVYSTTNAFLEPVTGFITKMSKSITSICKADCRIIQGYEPIGSGQAYTERQLIPLPEGTTVSFTIPAEAKLKENPVIRVTLIGKGRDGEPGGDGGEGTSSSQAAKGKGGAGGAGGAGGNGGNIFTTTIVVRDIDNIILSNSGDDSTVSTASDIFSSADGAPAPYGYYDIMTADVLARPGMDGTPGGNGGDGDFYSHNSGDLSSATAGESVDYNDTTYPGGQPSDRNEIPGKTVGISGNITIYTAAQGGGGAGVGHAGGDATNYSAPKEWGDPGYGADADDADEVPETSYGNGGNGGHGGGGGGAVRCDEYYNRIYNAVISVVINDPSPGGKGGQGSEGAYGCAIIYW